MAHEQSFETRLAKMEERLKHVAEDLVVEKRETREYRIALQDKVDALYKSNYVGMGILMALTFFAPIVLKWLRLT